MLPKNANAVFRPVSGVRRPVRMLMLSTKEMGLRRQMQSGNIISVWCACYKTMSSQDYSTPSLLYKCMCKFVYVSFTSL